jgi:hypothetical protein
MVLKVAEVSEGAEWACTTRLDVAFMVRVFLNIFLAKDLR